MFDFIDLNIRLIFKNLFQDKQSTIMKSHTNNDMILK